MARNKSDEQLLHEALTTLRQGRTCMSLTIGETHPASGCLPTADLWLPSTAGDIGTYARDVESSLWDSPRTKSSKWSQARDTCRHLSPDAVRAAWEMWEAWHRLLRCAHNHTQRQREHFGLDDTLYALTKRCEALITAAGRR